MCQDGFEITSAVPGKPAGLARQGGLEMVFACKEFDIASDFGYYLKNLLMSGYAGQLQ